MLLAVERVVSLGSDISSSMLDGPSSIAAGSLSGIPPNPSGSRMTSSKLESSSSDWSSSDPSSNCRVLLSSSCSLFVRLVTTQAPATPHVSSFTDQKVVRVVLEKDLVRVYFLFFFANFHHYTGGGVVISSPLFPISSERIVWVQAGCI